jgi:hypothetical protein
MPRRAGSIAELPTERFWAKVRIEPSGCWIWTGARDTYGYGAFHAEGRKHSAHKWLYERCFGPVPLGCELAHIPLPHERHDPACVCPVHVRSISHRANLLEAPTGIAAINASKQCCPHGHPYSAENTYVKADGSRECLQCRRRQGEEFRRKNRSGNPAYAAKQRQYRRERSEKYNAARRAKYRGEHLKPERQSVCHAGHSLEDPKNVYFARGSKNCRECRKLAQRRYVERRNAAAARRLRISEDALKQRKSARRIWRRKCRRKATKRKKRESLS